MNQQLKLVAILIGALLCGEVVQAQERPAKRLANTVSVAVEEYGKAVDGRGALISDIEFEEAVSFLSDARDVAARLSGERAAATRALLDTLSRAVAARRPPTEVTALHGRFVQSLGTDGALDMPKRAIDLVRGQTLFTQHCVSCHGTTGMGNGPKAKGMTPPPPSLGDPVAMHDVSPALMFRVVSVGIAGTPMEGWESKLSVDERWSVVAYLAELRRPKPRAPGEGLFVQRCASCHGVSGAGDGALASALSKLPLDLSSFQWQAERSDLQIAKAIREGVPSTAMPPTRDLTAEEVAQLVGHVRALSLGDVPQPAVTDTISAATAATRVLALVENAYRAAVAGRRQEAGDLAFDAYIAFEPLETPARARAPGRVASMERLFADFKGAVKAGDLRTADRAQNAIQAGMPGMVEMTHPASGFWGNFLQSLLIILREGFEAILVIGAVVAFLIKTGNRHRLRSIWLGVGAGLAASGVTAVVLATVLRALPATREIIEGATMLVAVVVLFSVSYWLISKVEAAKWQRFIREKVSNALEAGGGKALAFVAFLAVYREGAETALFYQALFREGAGIPLALGVVVGGAALALIFVLFHRYGLKLPLRPFFAGTSALLYYMAFVFMGKGVRELQEGGVMSTTVLPGWPHVDALGLFPSVETLLAQAALLLLLCFALLKTFWPTRSVALPTVESAVPGENVEQRLNELEKKLAEMQDVLVEPATRDER